MEEGSEDPFVLMKLAERFLDQGITSSIIYIHSLLYMYLLYIAIVVQLLKKSKYDWNQLKLEYSDFGQISPKMKS